MSREHDKESFMAGARAMQQRALIACGPQGDERLVDECVNALSHAADRIRALPLVANEEKRQLVQCTFCDRKIEIVVPEGPAHFVCAECHANGRHG